MTLRNTYFRIQKESNVLKKETRTMTRQHQLSLSCLSLLLALTVVTDVWAQHKPPTLSEQEIQQIKEALPDRATVSTAKPRKVLIFWRCEGFFHGDGIAAGNRAFELMGEKTGAYTRQ